MSTPGEGTHAESGAAPEQVAVTIRGMRGKAPTSGSVRLRVWQKRERTLRGLKSLGICWGLAVAAVFLPLLHFVLVPLLLLAGPAAFFWIAGQEQVVLGGSGGCPDCGKTFEIVRSPARWPLSDSCNHCRSQVTIER